MRTERHLPYGLYTTAIYGPGVINDTINEHRAIEIIEGQGHLIESSINFANFTKETNGIDSTRYDLSEIFVKAWTEENNHSPFATSDTITVTLKFRPLEIKTSIDTRTTPTTSRDTLKVSVFTKDPNERELDSDFEVTVTIRDPNGNETEHILRPGEPEYYIAFSELPEGNLTIEIVARKAGYLVSPKREITIRNEPDNESPYIRAARWTFGKFIDDRKPQEGRHPDTLEVTFFDESGSIYYLNSANNEDLIHLWRNGESKATIKVRRIKHEGLVWTFEVISSATVIPGQNFEPIQGDLVNINYFPGYNEDPDVNPNVRDRFNNFVSCKLCDSNPKAPLLVGPKPVLVTVTVIPGGRLPVLGSDGGEDGKFVSVFPDIIKDIPGSGNNIVNQILRPGGDGDEGTNSVVIIDPGFSLNPEDPGELEMIKAIILDQVGNRVAETDNEGNGEQLGAAIATMHDGRNVLVIAWTNKNESGRDVGAGGYLLILESKWRGSPTTFRHRSHIPVPKKAN